jgi:hypothetical protein
MSYEQSFMKIETRFYPFVLISGRIERPVNAHTKSDTDLRKSFCETYLHNDKGCLWNQKLHLCISKCFPFTFVVCFLSLVLQKSFVQFQSSLLANSR